MSNTFLGFFCVVFVQIGWCLRYWNDKKNNSVNHSIWIRARSIYQGFSIEASATIWTGIELNISINGNGHIVIDLVWAFEKAALFYAVHVTVGVHHVAWHRTLYCSFFSSFAPLNLKKKNLVLASSYSIPLVTEKIEKTNSFPHSRRNSQQN